MKKIKVEISWEDKNYCCGWGCDGFGAVLCTNKTLDGVKSEFAKSLETQIKDMIAAGEFVPDWLVSGEYEIEFSLAVSALLRQAETFTTLTVISHFTGINQKLLSHYANSVKKPREAQRERIVNGLHEIGRQALAVQ